MDKAILEVINNFPEWKGNPFTLVALILERQREINREKLIQAGFVEAAELI